jgi:glycerate 2-kinase
VRALACPNALKGVLSAPAAAAALADGLRRGGVEAEELPVADGGDGTAEVLASVLMSASAPAMPPPPLLGGSVEPTPRGEWRTARVSDPLGRPHDARWLLLPDRTAVVEAAEAIGLRLLRADELDPLRASSRGLGELILAALEERPASLLVCLGGSATVDGGAGLREVLGALPVPTRVACDVRAPLLGERGAARAFGPQKGASPEAVEELERRLAAMQELAPYATLPGAGAAGGLGAAFAALGAELVPGAELVLEVVGFRDRLAGAALVVTGEGAVDRTTADGKAPAVVLRICREAGVRCAVFGGRIEEPLAGAEMYALSGRPEAAAEDLRALGARLAASLQGMPSGF